MIRIFVYGTLMTGQPRAYLLNEQLFLGVTKTKPYYRLFSVHGHYPALVDCTRDDVLNPGIEVVGEVYKIDRSVLGQLDSYEAVAEGLYERRPIELVHFKGEVESYFWCGSLDGLTDIGCHW